MMAAFTMQAYERLCEGGEAESVCYFNTTCHEFAHPVTLQDPTARPADVGVALVRRMLPLTRDGPGQWTHFEVLQEGAHA
jgi:hypothetical protein